MADQLEREDIERILREIHILVKRNSRLEAVSRLKKLLEAHPDSADLWEAYGDLLLSANQLEEAKDAYFRAKEIQKPRLNAEKKYADVVFKLTAGSLSVISEDPAGSPYTAMTLSILIPGAGQLYNREYKKAIALMGAWFLLMASIRLLGVDSFQTVLRALLQGPGIIIMAIFVFIYAYSAIDAYLVVKMRKLQEKNASSLPTAASPQVAELERFASELQNRRKDGEGS